MWIQKRRRRKKMAVAAARVTELKGEKAEMFRTALKSSRIKKKAVLKAQRAIKESYKNK